jgi:Fur family ferric uptake transcriptional regulator
MSHEHENAMADFSLGTITVSLSPLERFEEYLQSRGKRITVQRRQLVEHIFRRHQHFDADELIDEVSRHQLTSRVSRPTVYRTLRELVDAGLLRQMTLRGRAVYEHDYGYPQHDHLHCERCHQLIEFRSDEIQKLIAELARAKGFRVSDQRLIINGVCAECSKSQRRPKRPLDLV